MKNEGLDDGLLDMLDNIGKIVKTDVSKYKFNEYKPDNAEIKIQKYNDELE